VPIDEQLLEAHASYTDAGTGITERFLSLQLGSGRTIGVLSTPIGEHRSTGWVLCHSFAREQVDLMVADAVVARALAGAGYPVLRFQCQGYGDSEFPEYRASLSSHLRDTADAVEALRSMVQLGAVGAVGARFGGAVAALTADRLGLSDQILIAPVVNGGRYMNEMIRSLAMTQVASSARSGTSPNLTGDVLRRVLEAQGYLDFKGYPLYREVVEENSAFDLSKDVRSFDGQALIAQVSVTEKTQAGLVRLGALLERLGARVGRATVLHRQAPLFGQKHILITSPSSNEDLFANLHRELASGVVRWLDERHGPAPFAITLDAGDSLSRGRTHVDVEGEE
jgi:pimeloyl-ACP methyl ester carboxylesterase